jgi:hypothetical protein
MADITPTLTLTSNASSATTSPGPLSIALSLSATDTLDVTEVQSKIVDVSGTHANLWDASDFTASGAAGTDGAFLYFKNVHATVNIMIGAATLENLSNDGEADRLFTLKPGEFAWMPWDCTNDICVDANGTGTNGLEAWCFVRTGTA